MLPRIVRVTGEADSLAGLRIALGAVAAADGIRPLFDTTADARIDTAIRVAAVTPPLLAALHGWPPARSPSPHGPTSGTLRTTCTCCPGRFRMRAPNTRSAPT